MRKEGEEEEKIGHGHRDKVAVAVSIASVLPFLCFYFETTTHLF